MTTVAATAVALTKVAAPTAPSGTAWDEQQSTAAGNKFTNDGRTLLGGRNTNVASRVLTFYVDVFAVEVALMLVTVPGSATENGQAMMGPFPKPVFDNHDTTSSASTGSVVLAHNGANADLMFCPFGIGIGLFA
jgi:hypothetical protein